MRIAVSRAELESPAPVSVCSGPAPSRPGRPLCHAPLGCLRVARRESSVSAKIFSLPPSQIVSFLSASICAPLACPLAFLPRGGPPPGTGGSGLPVFSSCVFLKSQEPLLRSLSQIDETAPRHKPSTRRSCAFSRRELMSHLMPSFDNVN
jgi:hypothetical protein